MHASILARITAYWQHSTDKIVQGAIAGAVEGSVDPRSNTRPDCHQAALLIRNGDTIQVMARMSLLIMSMSDTALVRLEAVLDALIPAVDQGQAVPSGPVGHTGYVLETPPSKKLAKVVKTPPSPKKRRPDPAQEDAHEHRPSVRRRLSDSSPTKKSEKERGAPCGLDCFAHSPTGGQGGDGGRDGGSGAEGLAKKPRVVSN